VDRRISMKYTKEQRLVIGRRIYDGEIGRYEAAEEYGISDQTARDYMRLYRTLNELPPKNSPRSSHTVRRAFTTPSSMEEYEALTKEELIHELVKARIVEARLKKGYEVKGDGAQKEYIPLGSKSTR
jgi:transposase